VDVEVRFWGHSWSEYPDVTASLEEISEQIRAALHSLDEEESLDEMSLMEPAFACQGVAARSCGRDIDGRTRLHRYNLNLYCTEADLLPA
jgi:hypothetical protein